MSDMNCSFALCCWNKRTSAPSGGQKEDQHEAQWGDLSHSKPGTLTERFAAQNVSPCEDQLIKLRFIFFKGCQFLITFAN